MESGIGYGLGHVLFAEVRLEDGRPYQANFDSYRSLRIEEMPDVEVAIVPSREKPTGVGEPGVPPIGPAVANALARLGPQRPQQLPLAREGAGCRRAPSSHPSPAPRSRPAWSHWRGRQVP